MEESAKYAKVVPISDKIEWSPKAALGDALNRCPDDADLVTVWITKDGKLGFAKACNNAMAVYMLNALMHKITFD